MRKTTSKRAVKTKGDYHLRIEEPDLYEWAESAFRERDCRSVPDLARLALRLLKDGQLAERQSAEAS